MKILIVDDEKMNRRLLEDVLKFKGHDVISVANGAEALKKLQAQDFVLIISDIIDLIKEFCLILAFTLVNNKIRVSVDQVP